VDLVVHVQPVDRGIAGVVRHHLSSRRRLPAEAGTQRPSPTACRGNIRTPPRVPLLAHPNTGNL
jgi:hypothetical protein